MRNVNISKWRLYLCANCFECPPGQRWVTVALSSSSRTTASQFITSDRNQTEDEGLIYSRTYNACAHPPFPRSLLKKWQYRNPTPTAIQHAGPCKWLFFTTFGSRLRGLEGVAHELWWKLFRFSTLVYFKIMVKSICLYCKVCFFDKLTSYLNIGGKKSV